jgi:hypothetical protein
MKRTLAFGLMSLISTMSLSQATKLSIWNEDIGPVKGGNFLRDQQFLADGGAYGKNPGSGLFLIPDGLNYENSAVPLFQLIPVVKCITTEAKIIETPSADEMKNIWQGGKREAHPFLKLPGEKVELDLPVAVDQLLSLSVSLKAYSYGFTTSGGSVWTINEINPTQLSSMITVLKDEQAWFPKNVVFSWPKSTPYKGEHNPNARIDARFEYYFQPKFQRSMLVGDWKMTLGLFCDNSQRDSQQKYKDTCYMTRGLNRAFEGASPAKDLLGLGEDFTYYVGHPLTASPYKTQD